MDQCTRDSCKYLHPPKLVKEELQASSRAFSQAQTALQQLCNPLMIQQQQLAHCQSQLKATLTSSSSLRGWSPQLSALHTHQEPTETGKQPIRTRYLGHVTGYQPIRDQYYLIRSVPDTYIVLEISTHVTGSKNERTVTQSKLSTHLHFCRRVKSIILSLPPSLSLSLPLFLYLSPNHPPSQLICWIDPDLHHSVPGPSNTPLPPLQNMISPWGFMVPQVMPLSFTPTAVMISDVPASGGRRKDKSDKLEPPPPPYSIPLPQVCREYQRSQCPRGNDECKYAHPEAHIHPDPNDNMVTVCMDFMKVGHLLSMGPIVCGSIF
eukprot:sb/3466834/